MNFIKPWIGMTVLFLILVFMTGCEPKTAVPIVVKVESTPGWQTYINQKYNFSIEYPTGWQVKEVPSTDASTEHDEVWFAAKEFPPANTDARPDVLLIVTEQNPSAQWGPDYFNHYQSEVISLGRGRATKVSGVNKESLYEETVFIMALNGVYLQAFPGEGKAATESFDKILASLEPGPEAVSIPVSSESPTIVNPCISPYVDPVAFLPDNEHILVRAPSGIIVLNLETLEGKLALKPSKGQVAKATLSADGQTLAWALDNYTVELIDLDSGEVFNKLEGHTGTVTAIKFSAKGDRVYTASHDNSVRVWNSDGGLVSEFFPGGGEVLGIGVSPDDTRLAIVTFEGPQKLWNLRTNRLMRRIRLSGAFDGADAEFSPDGKFLGIGLGGGPVFLWDAQARTQRWSGGEYALAFSPDGRLFAYSDSDELGNHLIILRSLDGMETLRVLTSGPGAILWKLIFSQDGSRLASTDGSKIRVWQVRDGALLYTLNSDCP